MLADEGCKEFPDWRALGKSGPCRRHPPPLILRSPEGASEDARWPDLCCNQPLPRTTGGVSWNALRGYASLRASGRGRWIARGVRNPPTRDRAPSFGFERVAPAGAHLHFPGFPTLAGSSSPFGIDHRRQSTYQLAATVSRRSRTRP